MWLLAVLKQRLGGRRPCSESILFVSNIKDNVRMVGTGWASAGSFQRSVCTPSGSSCRGSVGLLVHTSDSVSRRLSTLRVLAVS